MLIWRSLLFAPATRPDRFEKAAGAGADAVCLDLEDSVPPDSKAAARAQIEPYLALSQSASGSALTVRINALKGADGLRDLLAIADAAIAPSAVLIPKVESPEQVGLAAALLATRGVHIVALIETVTGLRSADAIAKAAGTDLLMFGSGDYAGEVGCTMSAAALAAPRAHLVQAAASAGIACLDGAWLAIRDEAGLIADCAVARDLGFCGKPALHPDQIDLINRAFTPAEEAVADARAIIEAVRHAGGGVAVHRGRMLDAPVVRQAERVLVLAASANS